MGVSAAHIRDHSELFRGVLVWVAVGPPGTVPEGIPGVVIAVLPPINILPVNVIADGSLTDPVFLGIANK